jgi:hypothetical protein
MPFFSKVKLEIRNDGQRGIFALEPIPKGSIIWALEIK